MSNLEEITNYLDQLLDVSEFRDECQNGLQVESPKIKVRKVALAVDSGLSVIEQAVKSKAQLLIVHHGIFWGQPCNIRGILSKKINLLLTNGCSLYASHLPLDSHLKYGNAARLAHFLKLKDIKPFCHYRGMPIGVKARVRKPQTLATILSDCAKIPSAISPVVLPFGKKDITNIGIVTGSGSMALQSCADEDLDLLISGEAKQEAYHNARELKVNAIFAGHYATETFGVKAVGELLQDKFGVKTTFIDQPTGI